MYVKMHIPEIYLKSYYHPYIKNDEDDSDSSDSEDEGVPLSNYHLDVLKHLDMTISNYNIPDNIIIDCQLVNKQFNTLTITYKFIILYRSFDNITTKLIKEYFKNYNIFIIKYKKNNNIIRQVIDLDKNYCILNKKQLLFGRIKL